MLSLSLQQWKDKVLALHPHAQFTVEPPNGSPNRGATYGEPGDWVAHTGPDMQADVVGVFVPGDECWWLVNDHTTNTSWENTAHAAEHPTT